MKPERIQDIFGIGGESFAASLSNVLQWIEVIARELRRLFGFVANDP